ncbi:feruloyl esterase b protein [Penicillium sp. IBT 35674x]|nr:feruloyl esterase b protein [Penicillium sp. IBT 35674x]
MYPDDFDGIIAGAPAFDFSPRRLTQWSSVATEILRQCDLLDGVADAIIEDTSRCHYNPASLLCSPKDTKDSACLKPVQVETVRKVYSPLVTPTGKLLYLGFVPSAESSEIQFSYLTGFLTTPATDWYRYAIYNAPYWDPTTLSFADMEYADTLDEIHGEVSSFDSDLSALRQSGGKIITYHGMFDAVIFPRTSMHHYKRVSWTLKASHSNLDESYRFFRISGMGHCASGPGATNCSQGVIAPPASDDILEDIVEWVEHGVAWERAHCRCPYLKIYKGGGGPYAVDSWKCKLLPGW